MLAFLVRELKDRIPDGIPGFGWVKPWWDDYLHVYVYNNCMFIINPFVPSVPKKGTVDFT